MINYPTPSRSWWDKRPKTNLIYFFFILQWPAPSFNSVLFSGLFFVFFVLEFLHIKDTSLCLWYYFGFLLMRSERPVRKQSEKRSHGSPKRALEDDTAPIGF